MGNQPHDHDGGESSDDRTDQLEILVSRLESAGLDLERFIDIKEGRKQSFDHTKRTPDEVDGNYGVYCGNGLLGIDIDDMVAWADTAWIENLRETFTVSTPHDGKHRYYRASPEAQYVLQAAIGGSLNASLEWGELYLSKYLVGPGSAIITCNRPDCSSCWKDDPGTYEIVADRPIAAVSAEEVAALLQNDPANTDGRQASVTEFIEEVPAPAVQEPGSSPTVSHDEPLTFQLQLGEKKPDNLDRRILWKFVMGRTGSLSGGAVKFGDVIDEAGKNGIGVYRTRDIVASWVNSGVLGWSEKDPNRLIRKQPEREQ